MLNFGLGCILPLKGVGDCVSVSGFFFWFCFVLFCVVVVVVFNHLF